MTQAAYAPKAGLARLDYTYDAGYDRRGKSTVPPDIALEILRFGEPEEDGEWVKCSDGTWFRRDQLDATGEQAVEDE